MNGIDQKIELWKKKLLDLGKRNRLLNYRDTIRSGLRFETPDFNEMWDTLVIKNRGLEFPYIDEDDVDEVPGTMKKLPSKQSNGITTNQPPKEQQKTLRNLKTKAKSIREEQGVNVLHLAFGLFKWSEKLNSNELYSSPIILVPATLTQKRMALPFTLTVEEDEIIVNPTLAHKMKNDFGISLPDFPDNSKDADCVTRYFDDVAKEISGLKNWDVDPTVVLSLFSFLNINMFYDLENNRENITAHPIIKALCGDPAEIMNEGTIAPYEYKHDEKNPFDVFQILDADSSQQDAIVSAKKGLSFVLQGPPGTGKSQTIANIISECLADNKKVLFVSEKAAALDVVFKRLTGAGIGNFCLPIHSHKSNKNEILAQIAAAWELSSARNPKDDSLSKLSFVRNQLNQYCEELHKQRSALKKSVFEVYGELARLTEYKNISFPFNTIDTIKRDQWEKLLSTLDWYASTIENTIEPLSNPWRRTSVTSSSFARETEIEENLALLITRLSQVIPVCDEIKEKLSLDADAGNTPQVLSILKECSKAVPIPSGWIQMDITKNIAEIVSIAENLTKKRGELHESLKKVRKSHPQFMYNDVVLNMNTFSEFSGILDDYNSFVQNEYAIWKEHSDCYEIFEAFNELEERTTEYTVLKNTILEKYDEEFLELDVKTMLKRFQFEYDSLWRIFKPQFRKDKKLMISMHKNITKETRKQSVESIIIDLKELDKLKKKEEWFSAKHTVLKHLFGRYYDGHNSKLTQLYGKIENFKSIIAADQAFKEASLLFNQFNDYNDTLCRGYFSAGLNTDWNAIWEAALWAEQFFALKEKESVPINESFVKRICEDPKVPALCSHYHALLFEKSNKLPELLQWCTLVFSKEVLNQADFSTILSNTEACKKNMPALTKWIAYKDAKEACISLGIAPFIEKIESEIIKKEDIVPIFKKQFYKIWLDTVMKENNVLRTFNREKHEKQIAEFRDLDKKQFTYAQQRLVMNRQPNQDAFGWDNSEQKILSHELNKKRNIMPLRKLFQKIPNLLLNLKPCLMMSPLTVSMFLESKTFDFNTVIFDESSQVRPENAVGAIFRGKQLILAGDNKQLPPTSFFNAETSSDQEYDEDEDDETEEYESILDKANVAGFPSRTLKWHYRSRHEHLIAFSNAKMYENKLITFPSNTERSKDNGVEYIYVADGIYDRGGKRDNSEEAKKIVGLIFEHFKTFPERSLGIITFSEAQRETIETLLRKERRINPTLEEFFNEEKDEPFFIKNIETVQGDERDTILFSIGYAKDKTGKMTMHFGPLNKIGGERRLNVAITRAKYNVKLVGSLLPEDIKVGQVSKEGPKLLRAYIDFAIQGPQIFDREIKPSDCVQTESPFEQSVYDFLVSKGYTVHTQIGCSGYRIDLGIPHPTDDASYCLGIECDGASYHSARTARERDRLRQTILEDMGWKIYRIWSTDWLRNPDDEKEKLVQAINVVLSKSLGAFF